MRTSVDSSVSRWLTSCWAFAFALATARAGAATYIVGIGSGCTDFTLETAIDKAERNPGADTIRVTRSISHTQVAARITTSQELTISGGFATCTQSASDGTATTLDGNGGATEPVLRITGNTGAVVRLDTLRITGGDEDGDGYGGGIYFRGNGTLHISRSAVTGNLAGFGGGIYAEGTERNALMVIGTDVIVSANTARYSGGGIYVEGMQMQMREPGSTLAFNKALGTNGVGGYGGGLMLLSGAAFAKVDIGSDGPNGLGAVYANEARYGGGIALVAADDVDNYVQLVVKGTAQSRAAIRSNMASIAGGALYARPDIDIGSVSVTTHPARIALSNFELSSNNAPDGAAVYLDNDSSLGYSAGPEMDVNTILAGLACTPGTLCGEISDNTAFDGVQVTDGAIIRLRDESELRVNGISTLPIGGKAGIAMRGNRGGRLVYASEDSYVDLVNVLATGNETSQELLRFAGEDDSHILIRGMTMAGNQIGATNVLTKFSDTTIDGTIIWQPGKTTLRSNGGPLTVQAVIASEVTSLAAGPEAIVRDPRFVDPARGDYALRAASPAVDGAPGLDDEKDALGLPRNVDLPLVFNLRGARDVGALERQTLAPLVYNTDFDTDGNLWTSVTPGVSTWDGTQNAAGAAGSGSIKLFDDDVAFGQRVTGVHQCIHLPGPGTYALNGYGRSGAGAATNRDYVYLGWAFRRTGSESCTSGPATTSGNHFLSNSSSWQRPANPTLITVSAADWTSTSSIDITQVVVENGISAPFNATGWFDGITLDYFDPASDTIFRNGFDP